MRKLKACLAVWFTLGPAVAQAQQAERSISFNDLANNFASEAHLPIQLRKVVPGAIITPADLRSRARDVAFGMVFLERPEKDGEQWVLKTLEPANVKREDVDSVANHLISSGFVQPGFQILDFTWTRKDTGEDFHTLGTTAGNGVLYEPILYFNGIPSAATEGLTAGSWTWGPWHHTIRNGFGKICVEQEWIVKVQTKGCIIEDPKPHVELSRQLSNCWGWQQATASGEKNWCRSNGACSENCEGGGNGEDCIKWVVLTYVATGFTDITVNTSVHGRFQDIELDASISLRASRLGSRQEFQTIKNLCAFSGDLNR